MTLKSMRHWGQAWPSCALLFDSGISQSVPKAVTTSLCTGSTSAEFSDCPGVPPGLDYHETDLGRCQTELRDSLLVVELQRRGTLRTLPP